MRVIGLLLAGLLAGCLTPKKENEIKTDIFNLQTRVLQLEQLTKDEEGTNARSEKNSKQRLGAVQTDMERMRVDLQKMKGEIDALRVGVQTGEIPGTAPEEETVAQRIAGLQSRLESIESTQVEILEILENKAGNSSRSAKSRKIETLSDMRTAFNQRRYLHVADAAEEVSKKLTKSSSKEEALYLYAESLYKLGRLREAALKFNDFIESYSSSIRLAHAKLRMGDCFRHLGDTETAKIYYEELVSKYPKSDQATTAKERLERFDKQGASNSTPDRKATRAS